MMIGERESVNEGRYSLEWTSDRDEQQVTPTITDHSFFWIQFHHEAIGKGNGGLFKGRMRGDGMRRGDEDGRPSMHMRDESCRDPVRVTQMADTLLRLLQGRRAVSFVFHPDLYFYQNGRGS